MTRSQRAGWVLLAAGIALLLVIIGIQAWTGKDFLAVTLTVPASINGDLSDKDAQLDELEKQNADLRSFLDQSVPDQLRRLYHH
ncbi:MAG: hypothetical protein ACTHJQ_09495 [Rhizobiaceae bacterium]